MRSIRSIVAAGLVVVAMNQPAAADVSATQRVELSNFDFAPKEIHLRAGQPVALELANLASGGHDFSAPEFFAAARVESGDAALIDDGEIEVPGKATRTVHLVPAAGTYKLTCTHTLHAAFGMKGTIVVE